MGVYLCTNIHTTLTLQGLITLSHLLFGQSKHRKCQNLRHGKGSGRLDHIPVQHRLDRVLHPLLIV